jgi:hypothetical protein
MTHEQDRGGGPPLDPGGAQQDEVEREQIADAEGVVQHAGRTHGSPPLGPEVMGEDDAEFLRQPSPPLDPYTPEPGPRAGDQRAFRVLRWAWLPVLLMVAIIVWAAVR